MILSHYSAKPLRYASHWIYRFMNGHQFKPQGLWLSDDTAHGWKKWCEAEQWGLQGLKYKTEFSCTLTRWATLYTEEQLLTFTKQYPHDLHGIDWVKVREKFSGIIITPYQWNLRLDRRTRWYYSWDCASACVWDLSTVEVIVEKVEA